MDASFPDTAMDSLATGTLTCHFPPGSSTGRKALATSTFCPPASSRSNSAVTCERRRLELFTTVPTAKISLAPSPFSSAIVETSRPGGAAAFLPGGARGAVSLARRQLLEMLQPDQRRDQPRDQN